TTPPRVREVLGLSEPVAGELAGKATLRFLRWALGSSPSWQIALMRCGAPIPPGLFTQRPVAGGGPSPHLAEFDPTEGGHRAQQG
ncbi:MAG: hypothetical protein R3246_10190, partial [Acidimicrobiia bacterium]|nr:hypothetical protein [Acidimicrobiia bacterium]